MLSTDRILDEKESGFVRYQLPNLSWSVGNRKRAKFLSLERISSLLKLLQLVSGVSKS